MNKQDNFELKAIEATAGLETRTESSCATISNSCHNETDENCTQSRADSPESNTEEFEIIEDNEEEDTSCPKCGGKCPSDGVCANQTVETILADLESDYDSWLQLRKETISNLREIADYVDSVSKKSGIAKAIGSGSGALAGGLTLIGGALTIATAGAAIPVLFAGAGLGLAAGVGGGAAAVTEKIVKSRQMKAARKAIEADAMATTHLQHRVEVVTKDKRIAKVIAKEVAWTSTGVTSNSFKIVQLLGHGGGSGLIQAGITATAQIFGEDVGREVSKAVLVTSGRVFSGAVTVVFGGVTMIYDIYRLNKEVDELIKLDSEDKTNDIRTLAKELENALETLTIGRSDEDDKENSVCTTTS